jgi:hypothetical protein
MSAKYVVVVTNKDGIFDCFLNNEVYQKRAIASQAIKAAKLEDKKEGWKYEYSIYPFYGEIEAIKRIPKSVKKSLIRIDMKGILLQFVKGNQADQITSLIADKLLSKYSVVER